MTFLFAQDFSFQSRTEPNQPPMLNKYKRKAEEQGMIFAMVERLWMDIIFEERKQKQFINGSYMVLVSNPA